MNFYESVILIKGVPIKASSIGAVCTNENYRGKGYSSALLDVRKILKSKSTVLFLVSGSRKLYLSRGCTMTGRCYDFTILPKDDKIQLLRGLESFKPCDVPYIEGESFVVHLYGAKKLILLDLNETASIKLPYMSMEV